MKSCARLSRAWVVGRASASLTRCMPPLPLIDLSALDPAAGRRVPPRELAQHEALRPFDLSTGPLLRATLLRLGAEDHVLFFTTHHIVSDAWSIGVLVREVAALYKAYESGVESPLEELACAVCGLRCVAARVADWRSAGTAIGLLAASSWLVHRRCWPCRRIIHVRECRIIMGQPRSFCSVQS